MSGEHAERKHSKFAASAAERWHNCPGSVTLSEGIPDKPNIYSTEGTEAHEVLESYMTDMIRGLLPPYDGTEMSRHARNAANFIFQVAKNKGAKEILSEEKVYLDFLHPEAFGTFDAAVVDYFGTLHVFDYKYGAGVPVSATENLQMIFYGMGLAHRYDWNFKKVRLWIIQPRIKGYDGPVFWELGILRLLSWRHVFKKAIERVIAEPETYVEGSWCHWCKAKNVCPKKREKKLEAARLVFSALQT